MSKTEFPKPGNFLYPLPAVLVTCGDGEADNIITIAWTGTICSDPPMVYISVRKERYSYPIIKKTGEFVINLPSEDMVYALDRAGCTTGAKVDKFADCRLTRAKSNKVSAPSVAESPVCIECKVTQMLELGTHDMFLAEVVSVSVDDKYLDEKGVFHMEQCDLVAYEHGAYRKMSDTLGTFGFSVRKKAK